MKRIGEILTGPSLVLLGLLSLTSGARGDVFQTYDIAWSGAPNNTASATGTMTLDLTTLIDPTTIAGSVLGSGVFDIYADITSLTLTVTGASAGNGTFTKADLAQDSTFGTYTYWFTNGVTVDMEGDVLAQLRAAGGDFSLFFTPPGPQGDHVLVLATNGAKSGREDMAMTEFAPSAVPEPFSVTLLLTTVLGITFVARKRIAGSGA